jgi:hypothetical protein
MTFPTHSHLHAQSSFHDLLISNTSGVNLPSPYSLNTARDSITSNNCATMAASKQGGFKMSLGGLKGKLPLKASTAVKDAKKPRLALGDEDEDDSHQKQEISGWDAAEGGALDAAGKKEKEGPRVIPALPNRNWRDEARQKQLAKAPHTQAQNVVAVNIEEPKMQYGLTILKKEEVLEAVEETVAPAEPVEEVRDNLTEEQRLDKRALDALLNGKSTDDDLVIPVLSEEEAFRNEVRDAPDAPTLATYEATPIEGFGAALLRGMGWKEGETAGRSAAPAKPKEYKRRPALLGIGAKEEAAVGVELGAMNGKGKGKGKKIAQSYNPVTLRNKKTGELITEEELKAKLEQQDMVTEEKPAKRSRYSDAEDEEDERRRERRREKRREDRDHRHDDGDRKERSRKDDYDRHEKRKERYKDEDYDGKRSRDKRRDKDGNYDSERTKRSDGDRRDQSRSPRDDERDKRRDEHGSRSRDLDDHRKRSRRDRDYEYDERSNDRNKRHKDDRYSR